MKNTFLILFFSIFSLHSFAQPHAEFLLDSPDGCVDDELSFINLSFGGITDYLWDFGDGETSDLINPTHVYANSGTYSVELTVTDGDGLTDTWTEDYIVHPPVADFVLSPSVGCAIPHTVFFTDLSVLPDTWFWDFGDGNTSTLQNPVHNYMSEGEFTVTLTVTDTVFGCSSTHTDMVQVSVPTAAVDGEFGYFGCAPLGVDFEESSTPGLTGTIVSWFWDLGDGNTSDEMEPSHIYDSPGIYNVTLTVTNSLGCINTDSKPAFVQAIGPDVNFGADTTFAPCPDLTVHFTDSTIFGAPIISWSWDFGDGGTSSLQNPTYTFTDYGDYDISLTVTDIDGCSRELIFEDHIVIRDTINPIFDTCPIDQIESLSVSCDFILPDYTGLAVATDNCTDPLIILQEPVPGTIITADQVITLQTADESDSMASCTFNVFLTDEIAPVISVCPPDQNVSFDSECAYTLLDYTGMVTASDNCLIPTITQSPLAGTVITATQTITITATDTAGNITTCSFDLIPQDDTDPTITCPTDISVNNDLGVCAAIVAYVTPVGIDNCMATTSLIAGLASGSEFSIGTTINTFEVEDGDGRTATCSFEITVIDTELPEITCPSDIVVNNDAGQCSAIVIYDDPLFSDNCAGASISQTGGLPSGLVFPVGSTTNSFEVIDVSGNISSCSFNIVVIDNESPAISCPTSIETCESSVSFDEPIVSDNCGIESLTLLSGIDSGSEFPIGITTNTYEVEDVSGNIASCEMTIERFNLPTVDAGTDQSIEAGFSTQLDGTSSSMVTYSWSPPDGLTDPNIADPLASPEKTTNYILIVTTANGCQNIDEVKITVDLKIEINNYLSPNGDGKNDTWDIKGDYLLDACEIKILDSWGNQVYVSQGYDNTWDGTVEGEQLQQGVYYYIIACGEEAPLTGSITLIR